MFLTNHNHDSYHLQVGDRDVMVAYLLEVAAKTSEQAQHAADGQADDSDRMQVPSAAPWERRS